MQAQQRSVNIWENCLGWEVRKLEQYGMGADIVESWSKVKVVIWLEEGSGEME